MPKHIEAIFSPSYHANSAISRLCPTDVLILLTFRLWHARDKGGRTAADWREGLYALGANNEACVMCAGLLSFIQLYSTRNLDIRAICDSQLGSDEALFLQILKDLQQCHYRSAEQVLTAWLHPLIKNMALKSALDFVEALRKNNIILMQHPTPARVIEFPVLKRRASSG